MTELRIPVIIKNTGKNKGIRPATDRDLKTKRTEREKIIVGMFKGKEKQSMDGMALKRHMKLLKEQRELNKCIRDAKKKSNTGNKVGDFDKKNKKQGLHTPQWMKDIKDPYEKARLVTGYHSDVRKQRNDRKEQEKNHPTVCDAEGGCDLGIAFSQD